MGIKKIRFSLNELDEVYGSQKIKSSNIKNISKEFVNDGNYYKMVEKIEVNFKNTSVSNTETFNLFASAIPSSAQMMSFKGNAPVSRYAAPINNSDYTSLTYGIVPIYNYYATQYESAIEDLPEKHLINIYVSAKNGNTDNNGTSRHFSNTSITKESFLKISQKNTVTYLPSNLSFFNSTEIIYPQKYNFAAIGSYKVQFPFGVDMSIAVDNKNQKMKTFLKKADMYEAFVQGYLGLTKEPLSFITKYYDADIGLSSGTVNISGVDMLNTNLNSFLSLSANSSQTYFETPSTSVQGLALKVALMKGFFRQLIVEELKSYSDIVSRVENYYEPIFYKIEKSIDE